MKELLTIAFPLQVDKTVKTVICNLTLLYLQVMNKKNLTHLQLLEILLRIKVFKISNSKRKKICLKSILLSKTILLKGAFREEIKISKLQVFLNS